MFHIWQVGTSLQQETETMSALYAVALPNEGITSFGGIRPQGQYPASPLTVPSACASDAKRYAGQPSYRVNLLTETIAAVPQGIANRDRSGSLAGRTGSVAHRYLGVPLRGNDGATLTSGATAMGANSAERFLQG